MTTASRRRGTPSTPSTRPHQVQDFASRVHGTSTARAHRTMGAWPFLCVRGRPPLSMRVPGRYRSETLKARPPSPCRRGALLYGAAQGSYAHRRSTSLPAAGYDPDCFRIPCDSPTVLRLPERTDTIDAVGPTPSTRLCVFSDLSLQPTTSRVSVPGVHP